MQKIKKELLKKSGIYCIVNIVNNKQYIGSSKNLYSRLYNHRRLLRQNKHLNKKLQNSFNKYLEENFKYYIIEYCDENLLLEREQHYFNTINPELNITLDAVRNTLSKESRLLQSETRKRKIKSGEIKLVGKEIYQYDLNGNFIKKYDYIKQACIENNIHQSTICRFLNGSYNKGGGYLWSLNYFEKLEPYVKSKKDNGKLNKKVKILDYITKEEIFTFDSYKECAKYFNTFSSSISYAIKVQQKFLKKYLIIKA